IHRSNLVCMGVLPLQFRDDETARSLGLTGEESFTISGIAKGIEPRQSATVSAIRQDGSQTTFETTVRIDAPAEVEYFVNGGILDTVLRQLLQSPSHSSGRRK